MRGMAPKKRKTQIERPRREPWTVVAANDVTNLKYPPLGEWFSESHATKLALPAHPSHNWAALSVADLSAFGKPGMSIQVLQSAKEAVDAAQETEQPAEA